MMLLTSSSFVTPTLLTQIEVEQDVQSLFQDVESIDALVLDREAHAKYLKKGLESLSAGFTSLDASRPWLCYWILHSFRLLNMTPSESIQDRVVRSLSRWQHPEGGFGGGPGQLPHLAATYAAVNALVTIGTKQAYRIINREKLYSFLMRMKQPDGSFIMHEGGEVDVRGSYCSLSVATLLHIVTPELTERMAEFIGECQTYEGGFAAVPFMEAHGGYTFCAIAALHLLERFDVIRIDVFLKWIVSRQMRYEGGFQGRTNKLVDGCYSFWQGGVFPILKLMLLSHVEDVKELLYDREALQKYILVCSQHEEGGFSDRPDSGPDYYHTCYCLSGLSSAQTLVHSSSDSITSVVADTETTPIICGQKENELIPIHPIFNLCLDQLHAALLYFNAMDPPNQPSYTS